MHEEKVKVQAETILDESIGKKDVFHRKSIVDFEEVLALVWSVCVWFYSLMKSEEYR